MAGSFRVLYEGRDIYPDISVGRCWCDQRAWGGLDALTIDFGDTRNLWDRWHPEPGDEIALEDGAARTGRMLVSSVVPQSSRFTVAAYPAPREMRERRCKSWERVRLHQLIGEVAQRHGLSYQTYGLENFEYQYVEQDNESDLAFLDRRLTYEGASLIVHDGALVCYSGLWAEEQEVAGGVSIHKYDGRCSRLSPEEIQAKLDAGMPYVIRQKIPQEGTTTFHDAIFGDITVENSTLDDQVLIKRDGLPTYNFANVVDDHLMGITHVVRGSEYLSSAPKYNLLYEAFGWDIPTYVHCSPVMRDQHNKMSKRHGDPSYEDLRDQGYLTDAILNYVALLGWAPKGELGEQEIFSLDELVKAFDIAGISKSPAIFDMDKLTYFNATYLRAMAPEAFAKVAEPYIRESVKNPAIDAAAVAALLQARCEKLTEIPEKVDFFDALPDYDAALFTNKKSKTDAEVSARMLQAAIPALEALSDWTQDAVHDCLIALAESMGVKNATLMWPVRIAAAGKQVTPGGAVEICHILGKEEVLRRLRLGLEKLGA